MSREPAHNKPKKDARHYICKVLASRRAHYGLRGARRDVFGLYVMRNAVERHFRVNILVG